VGFGNVSASGVGFVFGLPATGGSAFGRNTINDNDFTIYDTLPQPFFNKIIKKGIWETTPPKS
jgi:hypothetical protein